MEVTAILVCLLFSAIFSAVEIAFFSLNEAKLHALSESGGRSARLGLHLRSNPQKLLATVLIGNNLANLAAAALVTVVTMKWLGPEAVAVATGLLTFIVLMFAEIVPKAFAAKHAGRVVQLMAYPVYGFEKLLAPVLFVLEPLILKITGGRGVSLPFATEEEVKFMLDAGAKAGTIETEEVKMIKNVFQLNDITAEDAMTPRIYVFGLEGSLKLGDVQDQLFQSHYSRIPVFDGSLDNITGVLSKNTALMELARGNHDVRLKDLARTTLFVPRSKPADDLMKLFQQEKQHMAVVVNEFGGVMGLVTLEDLIEELVGEIMDETDISEELIKRIGKNQILVHGRTEVRRINEFLKVDLGEEANTISGLIQNELGRIPATGEELMVANCRLVVREADPKSIKAVLIHKEEEKAGSPPAEADRGSLSRIA